MQDIFSSSFYGNIHEEFNLNEKSQAKNPNQFSKVKWYLQSLTQEIH